MRTGQCQRCRSDALRRGILGVPFGLDANNFTSTKLTRQTRTSRTLRRWEDDFST